MGSIKLPNLSMLFFCYAALSCAAAYMAYVMVGTSAPGLPAWQTSPEQLAPVLHESLNFFYVNVGLAQLGLNPVPSIPEHPVRRVFW